MIVTLFNCSTSSNPSELPTTRVSAPPPSLTFSQLARRLSKKIKELKATGKQISVASRQMASGIKVLNDGVGMLKRKLSRVKY